MRMSREEASRGGPRESIREWKGVITPHSEHHTPKKLIRGSLIIEGEVQGRRVRSVDRRQNKTRRREWSASIVLRARTIKDRGGSEDKVYEKCNGKG